MGNPLIGRDTLIRSVHASLCGTHQLLSVVGPAGVGKTALVRAALVEPVVWDLSDVRSAQEALQALATLLDVEATGLTQRQHLGEALEMLGARCLWVDHADPWQADLLEWLAGWWIQVPTLRVVWTSRMHLPDVYGPPLRVDPLGEEDALKLFTLRASPTGELPEAWTEDTVLLIRRLGGLPLALEMAASWTTLLTPSELVRRIGPMGEGFLSTPTMSERAERLRSAIAWSWSLLTEPQRQVARICAARPAGALLEDLEEVAEVCGVARDEVASILYCLRRHSLLDARTCPWTTRQRVALYKPVRAFLLEQYDPSTGSIFARSTQCLVERAEQYSHACEHATPKRAIHWLHAERSNLLAAMDRERNPRPLWAARAALALAPILKSRGPWPVHQRILREALLCAETAQSTLWVARAACALSSGLAMHGHFGEADHVLCNRYASLQGHEGAHCTAHILIIHAHIVAWLDEDDRAHRMLERAAKLLNTIKSNTHLYEIERVHICMQRAFLAQRVGTSEALHEAYAHIEEATIRADATNFCRLGFLCRYIRGQILLDLDRPREAYASLQVALEGLVDLGEVSSEATGLQWMARAARCLGDRDHARDLLTRGIERARQRADVESEVYLQAEWVEHFMSQHNVHAARQALRRTRRLAAQSHLPSSRRLPEHLQHHLDRLEELIENTTACAHIHISPDASRWYCNDDETALHARPTLRRVLARLCEARERRPGQMIDRETLFAAGWPNESIQTRSRHQRVYTAIWTLRKLGLGEALLSNDVGYALCPVQTVLLSR